MHLQHNGAGRCGRRPRRVLATAVVGFATMGAAAASADASDVEVKAFSASATGGQITYRVVVCAPIGTKLAFRPEVTATRGRTYVLPVLRGTQRDACPIWRFTQAAAFPAGDYTTQVSIRGDGEAPIRTKRVKLTLGGRAA